MRASGLLARRLIPAETCKSSQLPTLRKDTACEFRCAICSVLAGPLHASRAVIGLRLQPLEDRSLLAATVYVNDDWSSLADTTPIADADPVAPGNQAAVVGTDAFATIQDGIDNVDAGGTVNVLAGTYNESPAIGQSLSLLGIEGRDVTTINLQTGPTYLGGIDINGTDVTLSGFTIVGFDGTATHAGQLATSSSTTAWARSRSRTTGSWSAPSTPRRPTATTASAS